MYASAAKAALNLNFDLRESTMGAVVVPMAPLSDVCDQVGGDAAMIETPLFLRNKYDLQPAKSNSITLDSN